ncbi:MAG: AAA family ATPase [Lachnospiraceae bacterium]|nr:AAA family ATPase [Lachnospiraceae bacterium]
MAKKVIHIFGSAGAGTSTLGRALSNKLRYFFMDTDAYYWAPVDPPFSVKREPAKRVELMQKDIDGHDNVVISGALSGWGDVLIPEFTLAVRVETETSIRIERLRKRERDQFGSRIDPGGDMQKIYEDFIEWAARYDEGGLEIRSKARHDEWQKKLQCPVVLLDGSLPVETNLEILKEYL